MKQQGVLPHILPPTWNASLLQKCPSAFHQASLIIHILRWREVLWEKVFCWRKQCNNAMTQLGLEPRPLIIGHWVSHPGLRVVNEFSWHSYHNNVNWRHDYSNSDNDNDNDDESKINNNKNYRYDTIFFRMIWCSEINLRTNYHHCLKYIYLSI